MALFANVPNKWVNLDIKLTTTLFLWWKFCRAHRSRKKGSYFYVLGVKKNIFCKISRPMPIYTNDPIFWIKNRFRNYCKYDDLQEKILHFTLLPSPLIPTPCLSIMLQYLYYHCRNFHLVYIYIKKSLFTYAWKMWTV